MITTFSQSYRKYEKSRNFCAHFLSNFSVHLNEIWCAALTHWFVEAHVDSVHMIDVQGSELHQNYFWKEYVQDCISSSSRFARLHFDTYKLISFKLGMKLDMTKFFILMSVWMILTFTEGHRVRRKLLFVQMLCCKVVQSSICSGWLHKETSAEKTCGHGKYGLFEHLLIFLKWKRIPIQGWEYQQHDYSAIASLPFSCLQLRNTCEGRLKMREKSIVPFKA